MRCRKRRSPQLTKVVADATDKSMVASTAAEAAAQAKAESIVSQAGEWAGAKIREAGDLVLSRIQAEMQTAGRRAEMAARRAMMAAYIIGFAGLCLVAGITGWLGVFLRWW